MAQKYSVAAGNNLHRWFKGRHTETNRYERKLIFTIRNNLHFDLYCFERKVLERSMFIFLTSINKISVKKGSLFVLTLYCFKMNEKGCLSLL